jgi:hypothetical protein
MWQKQKAHHRYFNKVATQVAMLASLLTVVIIAYALAVPFFQGWLTPVVGIVHGLLVAGTLAAHVWTTFIDTTDPLVVTSSKSGPLYCNICEVCTCCAGHKTSNKRHTNVLGR